MLLKVMPEKIYLYWPLIKNALEETVENCSSDYKDQILEEMLLNLVDVWLTYRMQDGKENIEGIAITKMMVNLNIGEKAITIISLYCPNGTVTESFKEAFETISKYAKKFDCKYMDFFTDNQEIIAHANRLGLTQTSLYFKCKLIE